MITQNQLDGLRRAAEDGFSLDRLLVIKLIEAYQEEQADASRTASDEQAENKYDAATRPRLEKE